MSVVNEEMLKSAKSGPKRQGKLSLIKHLSGKRITQRQAIQAKCYDCNGMGEIGDCDTLECSLWPYSPYGGLKKGIKRGLK